MKKLIIFIITIFLGFKEYNLCAQFNFSKNESFQIKINDWSGKDSSNLKLERYSYIATIENGKTTQSGLLVDNKYIRNSFTNYVQGITTTITVDSNQKQIKKYVTIDSLNFSIMDTSYIWNGSSWKVDNTSRNFYSANSNNRIESFIQKGFDTNGNKTYLRRFYDYIYTDTSLTSYKIKYPSTYKDKNNKDSLGFDSKSFRLIKRSYTDTYGSFIDSAFDISYNRTLSSVTVTKKNSKGNIFKSLKTEFDKIKTGYTSSFENYKYDKLDRVIENFSYDNYDSSYYKSTYSYSALIPASIKGSLLLSAISIYPNPANNFINLKMKDEKDLIEKVIIKDLLGNLLIEENISTNLFNISSLPTGLFFLEIYTTKGLVVKTFLRE